MIWYLHRDCRTLLLKNLYTRVFSLTLLLVNLLLLPTNQSLAAKTLVLSIHPYQSATKLLQAYTPLVEYLGSELGVTAQIQIDPDYAMHVQRIGKNEVDLAYMGPASYVELVDKYGKKPIIARQYINGIPTFQGKFITRKDSAIHSIADLNGKRFAFGDKGSTMSHLVPQYMLIEANVQLKTAKFLGSHDNVALGVLTGDYDAGAVKEAIFYKYAARGLKAIATTPALSEHLFVARSNMDKTLYRKLCKAFYILKDKPNGKSIMNSIKSGLTEFGSATDHDYDNLRKILDVLKRHDQ